MFLWPPAWKGWATTRIFKVRTPMRAAPASSLEPLHLSPQDDDADGVGFHKATKLVYCVLPDVYMGADSNPVFRRVEEPIH
jgi:hypothetical protein